MTLYVGIDPGAKGAIVALDDNEQCVGWDKMPVDPNGRSKKIISPSRFHSIIEGYTKRPGFVFFALEKATTRPAESAASGLTTGIFFAAPWGIIAATRFPYALVRPQEWHREMCRGESGDPKERSMKVASRLWPNLPIHGPRGGALDGFADAACIAAYVRRKVGGA